MWKFLDLPCYVFLFVYRSKRRRSSSRGSSLSGDISDIAPQASMTNLPVVPEEAEYHISPVKIPKVVEEVPVPAEDRLVR